METIQEQHKKHLAVMRGWLDGRQFYQASEALEWVRQVEQGLRKDGTTPKFDHQLSVARLVLTLAPHLMHPEGTLTAAFLHDMVEDHGELAPQRELERRFGGQVADAVWKLSKKTRGLKKDADLYFEELAQCPIASVVKLADRAHNLQSMQGVFSQEKQRQYIEEVEQRFFPLVRQARRAWPRQFGAYENLKILLHCQVELIQAILGSTKGA